MTAIVKYTEYNVEHLDFEVPLGSQKKKNLQNIQFPIYDGGKSPLIQLPFVELDMYGVPSRCEFYKEDHQRLFLKLPLNMENPEIKNLRYGFLTDLDARFGSDEYKEDLFGAKASKYTYQPILRFTLDDEGNINKDRHPYIKLKLLTKYPTNEIQTKVIEQRDDEMIMHNDVDNIDSFARLFPLRSKIKCMIVPIKLWIHPATVADCAYGITFKLVKVLVVLPVSKSLQNRKLENGAEFIDDDDEET